MNYRSCIDTEVKFDPKITALIGPNGAGKTNLLQAVLLFGQPGVARRPKELNSLECKVEADFLRSGRPVKYRGRVTYRSGTDNRDEALSFDERWSFPERRAQERAKWINMEDFQTVPHRKDGRLHFSIPAGRKSEILRESDISRALKAESQIGPIKRWVRISGEVANFTSEMSYYSASQFTNPAICETSFEIDEKGRLSRPATHRNWAHLRFMYDLYIFAKERPDAYDLFLSFVDRRGLKLVNEFLWRSTEFLSETHEVRSGGKVERKKKKRILIIPTVKIGSSKLSFNQLSEGTFRTLALIFYVVSDTNSLLLIEEPEVCVHHGLLRSVVSILKEFSRTKQIIFSTHSEAIVDSLDPEQLRLVAHSPRSGTKVKEVSEAFSKVQLDALRSYLATTGSLGEFWRSSGFD